MFVQRQWRLGPALSTVSAIGAPATMHQSSFTPTSADQYILPHTLPPAYANYAPSIPTRPRLPAFFRSNERIIGGRGRNKIKRYQKTISTGTIQYTPWFSHIMESQAQSTENKFGAPIISGKSVRFHVSGPRLPNVSQSSVYVPCRCIFFELLACPHQLLLSPFLHFQLKLFFPFFNQSFQPILIPSFGFFFSKNFYKGHILVKSIFYFNRFVQISVLKKDCEAYSLIAFLSRLKSVNINLSILARKQRQNACHLAIQLIQEGIHLLCLKAKFRGTTVPGGARHFDCIGPQIVALFPAWNYYIRSLRIQNTCIKIFFCALKELR
ncbi:hypothetical protein PHYBLDRAFT_167030 [Phycomyces blakesleeanus NRRL 1555(-)]|uniref:Uncharacterized protein n=1 Tax=Phycomyces blakesleeanus (strain ATCC 8743b / DSM 1359 / FGSC 10004 / NBRC 33097 / NRRL 1555) TaxID=763407 RepID=A0A163ANH9_PHYB8|nr:hypothetical protein PHYBLDRAFT_167030 [Phycomyces blakesleeanus NRRL 1555(-)]OAD74681.1 hypothetical protein PHYBLDRAFT_167030 [Phycomyces blakesleeanus NRRL 1555(-)]|eukprot:XP_018292721.1 hypothetical protein PHYBLDRAFT_167030 [Phycomyces blakesleeanus NRRL 1555(-)]